MTLQTSGPISIGDIKNEFGRKTPSGVVPLSDYYRNGGLVGDAEKNKSISKSGMIALSMFYGSSKEIPEEEFTNIVGASFTRYGRLAPAGTAMNWGNGWFSNTGWGRKTSQLNLTYSFSNAGDEVIDSWCSIVVTHSCGEGGTPDLSITRITDINDLELEFKLSSNKGNSGNRIIVYKVNADRSKIKTISTRTLQNSRNTSHSQACVILPGTYVAVSAASYVDNKSFSINKDEIVVVGARWNRESWTDLLSTSPSVVRHYGGTNWYESTSQTFISASLATTCTTSASTGSRWYNNAHIRLVMRLRLIRDSVKPIDVDGLSNTISSTNSNAHQSTNIVNNYSSTTFINISNRPGELFTVLDFKINSSTRSLSYYMTGADNSVGVFSPDGTIGNWSGSGTITVKTISGRTISGNWSASGWVRYVKPPEQGGA